MAEMVTEHPTTSSAAGGSTGERVRLGSFDDYADAQRLVDRLSDRQFPVQFVSIVGTNLRMIEQVTGRLSWGLAALRGMATGAWLGVFAGLLVWFFALGVNPGGMFLWVVLFGAVFGLVAALVAYAATRGRRDFVSRSTIVPGHYDVMVEAEAAAQARAVLSDAPAP